MKMFYSILLCMLFSVFVVNATSPCEQECMNNLAGKNPATCPSKRWADCANCCLSSCCFQGRGGSGCKVNPCPL